jgi:hypothetical protein
MRSFSTYFSDDGRARADVFANGIAGLRVQCELDGRVVAVINSFSTLDDAEDFAEDFVLNKKNNNGQQDNRQSSVLYRIAEPNERNGQPCMG